MAVAVKVLIRQIPPQKIICNSEPCLENGSLIRLLLSNHGQCTNLLHRFIFTEMERRRGNFKDCNQGGGFIQRSKMHELLAHSCFDPDFDEVQGLSKLYTRNGVLILAMDLREERFSIRTVGSFLEGWC